MTKLEELLYSLAAVIVRYHDIQPNVKKFVTDPDIELIKKKAFICAKEIIQNQETPFKSQLTGLIKHCADGGRKPFLFYIVHQVASLKALRDKTSSFDPEKLAEFKNQIYQLFIDFKRLLDTPKHKTCKVIYSKTEDSEETSIALSGLKNDGYLGGELCNSGEFLSEGVLKRFNLNVYSSTDEIREIAEQICMEHQNALLVPELLLQNIAQKKVHSEQEQRQCSMAAQSQEGLKKQESISVKQQMILFLMYVQFKKLQTEGEKLKKVIKHQQETIDELKEKISELAPTDDPKSTTNYRFYSPTS